MVQYRKLHVESSVGQSSAYSARIAKGFRRCEDIADTIAAKGWFSVFQPPQRPLHRQRSPPTEEKPDLGLAVCPRRHGSALVESPAGKCHISVLSVSVRLRRVVLLIGS